MAAIQYIIKVRDGNNEPFVKTDELEVLFKALGVDGVSISKDGNGNLVFSAPIIAPAGAGNDSLATVAYVDDETSRATTAEGVLQGNIDTNSSAISGETSRATTAEGVLQGNIDTVSGDLATLTGRVDAAEVDIGDLQTDVAAILANTPKEQVLEAIAAQVLFDATAPGLVWDALNSVRDIEVYVDGRLQERSVIGDFSDGVWRKNSTTQIEFDVAPGVGRLVSIWKQGTSSGSGGGSGVGQSQGSPANAFYLLDQGDNTTVWKLSVVNGSLDLTSV